MPPSSLPHGHGHSLRPRLRRHLLWLALLATGGLAGVTTVGPAIAGPAEEAREHFKAGVRLLQDPDGARYEDAYREFRAAYAASPNPKILGNIGFCAMKLERDGESVEAYARYLAEVADVDPEERDQITKDLQTMNSGLVRLTIDVPASAGAVTVTDTRTPVTGTPVVNTYGPFEKSVVLGVRPGRHVFRLRNAAGDESKPWELDAAPGAKLTHAFVLEKPASETKAPIYLPRPLEVTPHDRTVPWIVTGLGGAMLIGGAVSGLVVLNKMSRLESRCPNDTCPAGSGLEGDRDSIKKLTHVTDFFLVGGAVVAGTGVLWLLLASDSGGGGDGGEAPPPPVAGLSRPDLACSGQGCTFTLMGRF